MDKSSRGSQLNTDEDSKWQLIQISRFIRTAVQSSNWSFWVEPTNRPTTSVFLTQFVSFYVAEVWFFILLTPPFLSVPNTEPFIFLFQNIIFLLVSSIAVFISHLSHFFHLSHCLFIFLFFFYKLFFICFLVVIFLTPTNLRIRFHFFFFLVSTPSNHFTP